MRPAPLFILLRSPYLWHLLVTRAVDVDKVEQRAVLAKVRHHDRLLRPDQPPLAAQLWAGTISQAPRHGKRGEERGGGGRGGAGAYRVRVDMQRLRKADAA